MTIVVNLMNNLKKKFTAESSKIPSESMKIIFITKSDVLGKQG